jgi:hypothetical protein
MTKQLNTQVDIQATPDRVWEILTNFGAYPAWNPFMVSAVGTARRGERLTIQMQPAGGRAATLRPTVLEASPGRQLRWRGQILARAVFAAEHTFTIEPIGDGRVRLTQREDFRGVLVPFLAKSLDKGTLPAFKQMNEALKRRAEQPAVQRG